MTVQDATTSTGKVLPKPKAEVEVGVSAFLPFVTPYRNAWEAWRDEQVTVRQLTAMRETDGQARALYRLITLPVRAALRSATFMPESQVDGGEDEAKFIEQMLTLPASAGGMTVSFNAFIAQLLLAVFNGFSAFEMVYWVPTRGPLKGKWTLQKLAARPAHTLTFLLDDKSEYAGLRQRTVYQSRSVDVVIPPENSFYYACVAADTKIPLLDGTTVPIAELAKRNEPFWVYSMDGNGRIVPGRANRAWRTGRRRIVEVVLDDGSIVRATPDHRFMLRDGTYREARDLLPGESLMPLYRREHGLGKAKKPYEQVYSPGQDKWVWTHRAVGDYLYGPGKTGWVTHHVDVDAFNNSPDNLARVTLDEHYEIHKGFAALSSEALRAYWKKPGNKERHVAQMREFFADPDNRARWLQAIADFWSSKRGQEMRAQVAIRTRRQDVRYADIVDLYRAGVRSRHGLATQLAVDPTTISNRLKEEGFASWTAFVAHLGLSQHRRNVDRDELAKRGTEKMNALWQEPEFAAASAKRSRDRLEANWSNPEWAERQRARLRDGWEKRRARLNHRVVEVRPGGVEDVYDIEVDSWHNFATESVFVHNCNEEEKPFYGQSYFISAFHHWDKKFRLYTIAHIAAQRAAVGTRVGTMPKSPSRDEKDDFKKALSDLGVAQWMTIPDDYKVESLREAGTFDFLSYINHHNSQMSKSVLAAFFDDSQGSGGDASLVDFGRQSDALFMLMLQTIMGEIEEVINNKVIPRFIDWNFGTGKYPKFQFGSLTEEQKAAIVDIFKTLAVAGQSLTISPEFVHELEKEVADSIGLEIDWETVEAEQAEEKQRIADMAAQGVTGPGMTPGEPGVPPGNTPPAAPGGAGADTGAAPTGGHPLVDPSLLPRGFTLSTVDDGALEFTDYARELLTEAIDNLELTRGRTIDGGPKVVRTPEGARVYGVPIGTPITRDMEHKAGSHGVEGKAAGAAGVRGKAAHAVLGGGLGDTKVGHQDSRQVVANLTPKRIFTNPKQPGAQLLDFGDGTVAVRDANGNISPRQRFNVASFARLGWKVDGAATGSRLGDATKKATATRAANKAKGK